MAVRTNRACFTVHQGHIDGWNESAPLSHMLPDIDVSVDYILPGVITSQFKYIVWAVEEGGNTDRLHLQMYVQAAKANRMSWWRKRLPGHMECQSADSTNEEARDYCKKITDSTFRRGPWEFGIFAGGQGARSDIDAAKEAVLAGANREELMLHHTNAMIRGGPYFTDLIEVVRKSKVPRHVIFDYEGGMKEWHRFLIFMVTQPVHFRKFYWVFDSVGNTGKSLLAKYFFGSCGAFCATEGTYANLMFAYGSAGCPRLVIMDIPRGGKVGDPHCIEDWKNGMAFSSKYKSQSLVFEPPHIIVFSNEPLGGGVFSEDRPVIITIRDGEWTAPSKLACISACPGCEGL